MKLPFEPLPIHAWLSGHLLAAACVLLSFASPCAAAWPDRSITIVVGAAPGGTGDQAARIISEKLGAELGTTIVVENKAGAGGILGSQYVARAAPDGYTIMMGNIGSHSINYSLYKKLPYQPDDFKAITLVISNPNILVVNSSTPFTSVPQLVSAIKKDSTLYSFGSAGAGQSPHLSGEMFMQRVGIQVPHIPYKGAGPATGALLGNQFTFMIATAPSVMAQIKGGKLRALAVTSDTRAPELPEVPTMAEAGSGCSLRRRPLNPSSTAYSKPPPRCYKHLIFKSALRKWVVLRAATARLNLTPLFKQRSTTGERLLRRPNSRKSN